MLSMDDEALLLERIYKTVRESQGLTVKQVMGAHNGISYTRMRKFLHRLIAKGIVTRACHCKSRASRKKGAPYGSYVYRAHPPSEMRAKA